jgi:hypothetical protein
MTITDAIKSGAGKAFVALATAAAIGGGAYLSAQGGYVASEAAAGHVVVGWGDAGMPAGAVLVHATARASPQAMAIFGVDAGGAAHAYFRCNIVSVPVDGGTDPGAALMPGADVVYDDDTVDAAPAGAPQLECWRQGRADAPFPCACSTGPGCIQPDGGPAPQGVTLQAGAFVPGAACLAKACVELAGSSSWPAECAP